MKVLWTLVKVVIALAIAIPVSIIAMGALLIAFGTLVGLAAVALRLAVLGLLAYGAFKLATRLLRGPKPSHTPKPTPRLEPADPYYTAAMRELDRELGDAARR